MREGRLTKNRLLHAVPKSSADVLLNLDAGLAGLAPSGDAEHVMLRLDDEMAGLVEAAEVPADSHGTHSSDAVSPMPGQSPALHSIPAAALLHKHGWCAVPAGLHCSSAAACCIHIWFVLLESS